VPEEHWTSIHRIKAGLDEFQPADGKFGPAFSIPDDPHHKFAQILAKFHGRSVQSIWQPCPKRWHLEVKVSEGGLADEFSLTWEQFERVRASIHVQTSNPGPKFDE
jgi:hypothetical protein